MKFSSLSQAILYYTNTRATRAEYSPYSSLAAQTQQQPTNTNYEEQPSPDVVKYGQSVWGIGKIIDMSKPVL